MERIVHNNTYNRDQAHLVELKKLRLTIDNCQTQNKAVKDELDKVKQTGIVQDRKIRVLNNLTASLADSV